MQDGYVILRKIIKHRGMDILNDRKVLSSLIEDLMPTNVREKTSLQLAVSAGVAGMFGDMERLDRPAIGARISSINSYITEELGITEQRASYIINAFMYGIGMDAVSIDPYETINYRELAEKYENAGHKDIALLLYDIVRNAGDEDTKYNTGMALLKSDIKDAKIKGIEILKTLTEKKEAMYVLGMEYLEESIAGDNIFERSITKGDLSEESILGGIHSSGSMTKGMLSEGSDLEGIHSEGSFPKRGRSGSEDEADHTGDYKNAVMYFSKALPHPPAILELGKLYFYGWGVKADLHRAIRLFEQYLKICNKGRSEAGEEDIAATLNATPFLIQCYYEDIL
nr:SEL1-like repeat protein [Lachnospiraceae bacterium]